MAKKTHVTKREDGQMINHQFFRVTDGYSILYPDSLPRHSVALCCVPQVVAQLNIKNFLI